MQANHACFLLHCTDFKLNVELSSHCGSCALYIIREHQIGCGWMTQLTFFVVSAALLILPRSVYYEFITRFNHVLTKHLLWFKFTTNWDMENPKTWFLC